MKRLLIIFAMVIIVIWTWFGWRYLEMMKHEYFVEGGNVISVNRWDHKRVVIYEPGFGKWFDYSPEGRAAIKKQFEAVKKPRFELVE